MSEYSYECQEKECCERPQEMCCEHKLKPNRTLIKCSCPGAVTLPLATVAGTSYNLSNVNVDTRHFHNPCIKFEFASNISTTAAILTLNFQITKLCKNQLTPTPIGPIWTFSRLVAVTESNTFTFIVCDCDACEDGCCNYSVIATVAGVATVGVTTISNATLSAIVADNPSDC